MRLSTRARYERRRWCGADVPRRNFSNSEVWDKLPAAGADPENELGGGQFRWVSSGVQGRSPGRGSGKRSPPEADDFSQLKGYLDVTSGILGGMVSLPPPPLNPPVSSGQYPNFVGTRISLSRRKQPSSGGSRGCPGCPDTRPFLKEHILKTCR